MDQLSLLAKANSPRPLLLESADLSAAAVDVFSAAALPDSGSGGGLGGFEPENQQQFCQPWDHAHTLARILSD